ncbi:hypothetical protein C8Q74DRAFT_981695 [Fomes fomentarius]|nr:hypothetical protein C8Q74DRAFT_981695 [Fomes fomentarius]
MSLLGISEPCPLVTRESLSIVTCNIDGVFSSLDTLNPISTSSTITNKRLPLGTMPEATVLPSTTTQDESPGSTSLIVVSSPITKDESPRTAGPNIDPTPIHVTKTATATQTVTTTMTATDVAPSIYQEIPASIVFSTSVSVSSAQSLYTTVTTTSSALTTTVNVSNSPASYADLHPDKSSITPGTVAGVVLASVVGAVVVLCAYRRRRKLRTSSEASQSQDRLLSTSTHLARYSSTQGSRISDEEAGLDCPHEARNRPFDHYCHVPNTVHDEEAVAATLIHPLVAAELSATGSPTSTSPGHSVSTEKTGDPSLFGERSEEGSHRAYSPVRTERVEEEHDFQEMGALQEGQILYEMDGGICLEGGPPGTLNRTGALRSSRTPLTLTLPPPYQLHSDRRGSQQ